jgi:glutamyl-tRNA synthetase
MNMKRIRTRFAPSPTGPLHMGGVRTALYAYLFAKKNNGDFILRIEDTDQGRFVPGAEDYIIESLKWCSVFPDEGVGFGGTHEPYRQSERKASGIYMRYAQQLIENGKAYYAFDTPEELDAQRKDAEAQRNTFQYGSATRSSLKNSLTLDDEQTKEFIASGKPYVIRLMIPKGEQVSFTDLIRGTVTFDSSLVDDKVLIKADGMPTYHLAHIVDDIEMEITHAIRGEEWLPSAPAHIYIYRFLGREHEMPYYAHLPLLLKPEGNGKLSKRDGDRLGFPVFPLEWKDPVSGEISSGYREKGYYPEAFVNILALLGWNDGTEKEIFSMKELIDAFSLERIHKAGAKFDPEKAKWINEQYFRKEDNVNIAERWMPSLKQNAGIDQKLLTKEYVITAVSLLKEKVQFENQLWEAGSYLFIAPGTYDEAVLSKKWNEAASVFFTGLVPAYNLQNEWTVASTEAAFKDYASSKEVNPGSMMQLFRVIISGRSAGAALFDMVALVGKEESCRRITTALEYINQKFLVK